MNETVKSGFIRRHLGTGLSFSQALQIKAKHCVEALICHDMLSVRTKQQLLNVMENLSDGEISELETTLFEHMHESVRLDTRLTRTIIALLDRWIGNSVKKKAPEFSRGRKAR